MEKRTRYVIMVLAVASFFIFTSWFSQETYAEELTARLGQITGIVEVIRAGEVEAIPAEDGMTLNVGSIVKTGSDSSVVVIFLSNNFIQLPSDSEIKIERHQFEGETPVFNARVDILAGRIRAILRELPPESTFEIKTPTAVAAVRGTTYYVTHDGRVYVQEGSVSVTNLITGQEIIILPGQLAIIGDDGFIDGPREPSAEEVADITSDYTPLEGEPYEPPDRPIAITPISPFGDPVSE